VSVQQTSFRGFANPVDPTPAELRAWAYHPDAVPLNTMPADWDLLVTNDRLIGTIFDLAMDPACPARRFALHCLYIYAANAIRMKFKVHSKRRLQKLVERAEEDGDDLLAMWAHNTRVLLLTWRDLLNQPGWYHDWIEGGLVRHPRRIEMPRA